MTSNSSSSRTSIPSCVKGRKGGVSIADCLIKALWGFDEPYVNWPAKPLSQLKAEVSQMSEYDVSASTVRSTIYGHPEIFTRANKPGRVLWKLVKGIR